jgi:hypothetical protein
VTGGSENVPDGSPRTAITIDPTTSQRQQLYGNDFSDVCWTKDGRWIVLKPKINDAQRRSALVAIDSTRNNQIREIWSAGNPSQNGDQHDLLPLGLSPGTSTLIFVDQIEVWTTSDGGEPYTKEGKPQFYSLDLSDPRSAPTLIKAPPKSFSIDEWLESSARLHSPKDPSTFNVNEPCDLTGIPYQGGYCNTKRLSPPYALVLPGTTEKIIKQGVETTKPMFNWKLVNMQTKTVTELGRLNQERSWIIPA